MPRVHAPRPARPAAASRALRLHAGITHTAASRALVSERRLTAVARRALQADGQHGRFALALAFVTDARMRSLNRRYAGNDYVTDVLSFAAREQVRPHRACPERSEGSRRPVRSTAAAIELGDIVLALPQAARQARAAGHPLARELDLLVAHGVLHLLGYDHGVPAAARRMDALQAQILETRHAPRLTVKILRTAGTT